MSDALSEIMARMTVCDLERAHTACERHGDRELHDILSGRLAKIAPARDAGPEIPPQPRP
jgi:hypothetical protein